MTTPRRIAALAAMSVALALTACSDPVGPDDLWKAPLFPTLDEFPPATVQPAPAARDSLPRTTNFRPFDMHRER